MEATGLTASEKALVKLKYEPIKPIIAIPPSFLTGTAAMFTARTSKQRERLSEIYNSMDMERRYHGSNEFNQV